MLAKNPMAEAWTLIEQLTASETSINARVARQGETDAEVSDSAPNWYLVRVEPGDDLRALRHLARRRFGVFRPMQQRRDVVTHAVLEGWEPVFPGWLFVFTWDIEKMQTRIRSCPGVTGILCHRISQKPVSVNPQNKQGGYFIDQLRELSFVYKDPKPQSNAVARGERNANKARSAIRLTKPQRRKLQKLKETVEQEGLWNESEWAHANELEAGERIALLQRTLNARPSQVVVQ